MSSKKRGRIEFKAFPVWSDWANKVINELPNGGRKGVPRGERIPFDLKKSACGLLATIYPRGIKTAGELGEYVGISADLVRKWRRESAFQEFIQDLEVQFTMHVLANLKDEGFFSTLYNSEEEPYIWGDTARATFRWELMNSLPLDQFVGKMDVRELKESISKALKEWCSDLNYKLPPIELPYQKSPALAYFYHNLALDLALGADEAPISSRRRVRGKKPHAKTRFRFRISRGLIEHTKTHPRTWLVGFVKILRDFIVADRPKEEILITVDGIKKIIDLLYPEKAGMGQDESTTV